MPQCQFLFFLLFLYFRKVVLEIFSELDKTKAQGPIFLSRTRSPKETRKGPRRQPHHVAARPLWPRLGLVWPPCGTSSSLLWTPSSLHEIRNFAFCFVQFREYFQNNFSETKNSRKQELALWHLVNRLVPENA